MRTRLYFTLAVVALLCTLSFTAAQASWFGKGTRGSGNAETRTLDLDEFDEIEVGGAFELDITFGDRQHVEITIDDNLWDNLEAEVKGGRLTLDWEENCRPDVDCRAEITLARLTQIDVHGAGDVNIEDFSGDRFVFEVHGAGDLEMNGEVDELEIQITGAGDVDTRDLRAKDVEIRISGAGSADVYASERLDARVSGAGDLTYYGDPEHKVTKVSGVGSIRAK